MTRDVSFALLLGLCLAALSWGLAYLPPHITIAIRLFDGFVLVCMLAFLIRKYYAYNALLMDHRRDILRVFQKDAEAHRKELRELLDRIASLEAQLASKNS